MPIVSINEEDNTNKTADNASAEETKYVRKPIAPSLTSKKDIIVKGPQSAELKAANKHLASKRKTSTILRYLVLTVVGLIMIYPLLWMVGATFKENSEIFSTMNPIPLKATFEGYKNGGEGLWWKYQYMEGNA
jgi:carbohydrate ABC transporter membrane protein 2, CUT1 family (TC 3.A.1.1.-)